MPSAKWANVTLVVNSDTGDDENSGLDSNNALETQAEADRRQGTSSAAASEDPMATILQRGYDRLEASIDRNRTKSYAEEFSEVGWSTASGTTTYNVPTTIVGGGFLRAGGVSTVNDQLVRGLNASGAVGPPDVRRTARILSLDEATPWWFAVGFRVVAQTAGTWGLFALRDPAGLLAVTVGFYGPSSLTKYMAYTYNGVAENDTLSTINVDGEIHCAEIWFDGIQPSPKYWLSIDDETPIQMLHTGLFTGAAVSPVWMYSQTASTTNDMFWRAGIWPVGYELS